MHILRDPSEHAVPSNGNPVTEPTGGSAFETPLDDDLRPGSAAPRRNRVLTAGSVAAVLLLALVGLLYFFGTPQSTQPIVPSSTGARGAPEPGVSGKQVPAADPSSPLAIEIPGCVCHSEDPALVESHTAYRMNQCAGCHVGGISMGR